MPTIVSVQALRAIAALAVTLCHFDMMNGWLAGEKGPFPLARLASGVDLFFVISGFVMVVSSGALFGAKDGPITFITRRVARIVPIYWIAMTIAIPLLSLPHDWRALLGSYLFIPYFASGEHFGPTYGVGWTLNYEMYFYALFSVAIFLRREVAAPALCAVLCVSIILGQWLQPAWAPLWFWTDPIVLEFAFGMVLALLYVNGVRFSMLARICLVVAGAVAIGYSNAKLFPPTDCRVIQWGIPCAMIFSGVVLGKEINFGSLADLVKSLGDASYAMYLLHPLIGATVWLCWPLGLNQFPRMLVLGLALLAVQVISVLTYSLFEKRSTRLLTKSVGN